MKIREQTINLYKNSGWKKIFAKIRFWDAPIEKLETFVPKSGNIIELGCGDGILSIYFALSSNKRMVIGVDIDPNRINQAKKGLKNTLFIVGDIRKVDMPKANAIVISHVLHHLSSYEEQERLIIKCLEKLDEKGKLIIMEIYKKKSLKYLMGWFFDHFLVPIFFEGRIYSKIYYRGRRDWEKLLEGMGTKVKTYDVTAGKPISNIIIISTK